MLETLFLSHCPPVYQSISIMLELPKYIQHYTGRRRIFGQLVHPLSFVGIGGTRKEKKNHIMKTKNKYITRRDSNIDSPAKTSKTKHTKLVITLITCNYKNGELYQNFSFILRQHFRISFGISLKSALMVV